METNPLLFNSLRVFILTSTLRSLLRIRPGAIVEFCVDTVNVVATAMEELLLSRRVPQRAADMDKLT